MFRRIVLMLMAVIPSIVSAEPPIGTPAGGGDSYRWEIRLTDYERITLRVMTPDDEVYGRSFPYGAPVAINLSALPGGKADGAYTWELRVVPRIPEHARKQLEAARANGDDKTARKILVAAGAWDAPVQVGGFLVQHGAIVDTSALEEDSARARTTTTSTAGGGGAFRDREPRALDQVIPDDLIVQGNECVGIDCVNGESFGFDTLRLKDINPHIHFHDTSSTSGFASNDWRLFVNDTASGGVSHFSVEDVSFARKPLTIELAAAASSVYVDSTGKIGFRTATPELDLHINTSNTPAIRFEQNASGGFTAQTWDIGANEAYWFVRDQTNTQKMPFRIRPGAPTSSIEIRADGKVGIGTATAAQKLDVEAGNIQLDIGQFLLWGGSWGIIQQSGTNNLEFVQGATRLALTTGGNVGIGTTSPASLLHVSGGDIRVSGGSFIDDGVTLNVPDYVFDERYTLMPIPELAKFVREQKHLPNIPSARQIAAGGLNMSQFQMRLLEKIEELTLYTLQQHETIAALHLRLEALEKELKRP